MCSWMTTPRGFRTTATGLFGSRASLPSMSRHISPARMKRRLVGLGGDPTRRLSKQTVLGAFDEWAAGWRTNGAVQSFAVRTEPGSWSGAASCASDPKAGWRPTLPPTTQLLAPSPLAPALRSTTISPKRMTRSWSAAPGGDGDRPDLEAHQSKIGHDAGALERPDAGRSP